MCVCNAPQTGLDGTQTIHPPSASSSKSLQNRFCLYTPSISYTIRSYTDSRLRYPTTKKGALKTFSRIIPPDATVHVDVAVSEAADGEHHAVRVEGRAGDGARPRGREEGGVGWDSIDGCAGDVE